MVMRPIVGESDLTGWITPQWLRNFLEEWERGGLDMASVAWSYSTFSAMGEDIEDVFVKPAQPQGSEGLTLGPALNN